MMGKVLVLTGFPASFDSMSEPWLGKYHSKQVAFESYISQSLGLEKMAGGGSRKISCEEIQLVQNRIERCLSHYMTQKEVVNTLLIQDNIEPRFTELVWQKLEEENQEFFKAYYLRLMVKQQIMEFNKLLSEQVELMRRLGQSGIASIAMSNGSHIPSMHQNSAGCCTIENTGPTLKSENMHHPISAGLPNLYNNSGSSMPSGLQTAVDMPSHRRNIDVSRNMYLSQGSNRGIAHAMGGGMVKSEPSFAGNLPFEFGAHNNLVEPRSVLGEASVSSFGSVESNSQPLNGTLLDPDASSFGFFGQSTQNFNLPDLADDFSNGSDILDSYRSPFLPIDTSNFLRPLGRGETQGDIVRLNTLPENLIESLRYEDIGGD